MPKKITAYISLLCADGSEPPAASGYARACIGEVDTIDIPTLLQERKTLVPKATAPGSGKIAAMAVSDRPKAGEALWVWPLPEPLDCHEGVTPFLYDGQLYRGVEMEAKINVRSADMIKAMGGG